MYALQTRIHAYVGEPQKDWETMDTGSQRDMSNRLRELRRDAGGVYGGEPEYRVVPAIGSRSVKTVN